MICILVFGIPLVSNEDLVHVVHLAKDGDSVGKSLVEEVVDGRVLLDLLVSVEIGFEPVKIAVGEFLEGGPHGGSEGSIGVFEIALALMGGLGARCFVDFCTSTSTCREFSSGTS